MIAAGSALLAGLGTFYLYTAIVMEWRGLRLAPRLRSHDRSTTRHRIASHLHELGDGVVGTREILAATTVCAAGGALLGLSLFGAAGPATALAIGLAAVPYAVLRRRRSQKRAVAQEAWPHLIEELRLLTGSLGYSIPRALFRVGETAPVELRSAFVAARREWQLSTDFDRTLAVLKSRLADPTADAACETLLVAHTVGGADLDRRLAALAVDRRADIRARKEARAKQAGARFARRFVLVVPLGMAVAGLSVGPGRAAYQTARGQLLVLAALLLLAVCWVWASSLMRLPRAERVFRR